VRLLVSFENKVDRRVAHRVGGDSPSVERRRLQCPEVVRAIDDLRTVVGAAMAVGLLVRITHQSALEASVGDELEADEPQPIVAFVRLHAGGGNEVLDRGGSSQSPDQKGIAKADGALVAQRL